MANATVVVNGANEETPAVGGMFEGLSFFIVQRLPSRSDYVNKIQANGGRNVKLESQADHIIADHFRKDCPPGSISYEFIDKAITTGSLPDPKDHRAGPVAGTLREVGSAVPGKTTRTPFTAEDDRILWEWVEKKRKEGAMIKGNEIYKQLESKNPRHTYQAWRDRYIKRLIYRPPPGVVVEKAANDSPDSPALKDMEAQGALQNNEMPIVLAVSHEADMIPIGAAIIREVPRTGEGNPENGEEDDESDPEPEFEPEDAQEIERELQDRETAGDEPEYTREDFEELWKQARHVERIDPPEEAKAWRKWSRAREPKHSGLSWRTFYAQHVRPAFLAKRKAKKAEKLRLSSERSPAKSSAGLHAQSDGVIDSENREQAEASIPPARPVSLDSHSTKRKQESAEPEDAEARKKLKPDGRQTLLVKPSTQPIEISSSDDSLEHENGEDEPVAVVAEEISDSGEGIQSQLQHGDSSNTPKSYVNPLTEANLASQQAQHQAELLRSTNFATLELLPPETSNRLSTNVEPPSQVVSQGLDDLDWDGMLNMPLPSQQEMQEAFEEANAWPESPKFSQQFETQIPYPTLPKQRQEDGSDLGKAIEYPDLTEYSQERAEVDLPTVHDARGGAILDKEQIRGVVAPSLERPESYVEIRIEEADAELSDQAVGNDAHSSVPEVDQPEDEDHFLRTREKVTTIKRITIVDGDEDIEIVEQDQKLLDARSDSSSSHSIEEDRPNRRAMLHAQVDTQGILNAETQQLDLAIPSPAHSEEGPEPDQDDRPSQLPPARQDMRWTEGEDKLTRLGHGNGLSSVEISKKFKIQRSPEAVRKRRTHLSRDVAGNSSDSDVVSSPVNGQVAEEALQRYSPTPSLSVEPPSSDADNANSPLPAATSESQANLPHMSKLPDEDVDSYINKMLVFGYKEASIISALKCTSMRPELADLVLLEEKAGKGLPPDIAGIWSQKEDQVLESGNAREIKKLDEKHTWKECEERFQFLEDWRDAEE